LLLFSGAAIVFIIRGLIISHINKKKASLGTLKAFGVPNYSIVVTYLFVSFAMSILCFVISLFVSMVSGQHVLELIVILSKAKNTYLSQVEYETYDKLRIFVLLVLLPCIFILFSVFKKLNKVTPGDLIYGRK